MKVDRYDTTQVDENAFLFFSEGKNGYFPILVSIDLIEEEGQIFNLGFFVLDEYGEGNDQIETKNGDDQKILATAGVKGLEFLDQNPNATHMAAGTVIKDVIGNDLLRKRTRKYQMGINKFYDFLSERYDIRGLIADKDDKGNIIAMYPNWTGTWQKFKKGTNYDAFLLSLKKVNAEQI